MTRTPVTLLTGFLGSGKTTLLNRWLRSGALGPTAVIVNEAGAVGIDHLLVERGSEDTVLIDGGCVCCVQRSGLAETVEALMRRRAEASVPPFERIVIETSGLADPVPILQTFIGDRRLARQIRLDAVVAAADVTAIAATLADHPASVSQIAMADALVLTKADLAGPAGADLAEAALAAINPHASRHTPAAFDPARPGRAVRLHAVMSAERQDGGHGVRVASGCFPGALSAAALDDWLDSTVGVFGQHLLRLKAVLAIDGYDRPMVLHGIMHVVHAPEQFAGPFDGLNRLLLIARGLDQAALDDAVHDLARAAA